MQILSEECWKCIKNWVAQVFGGTSANSNKYFCDISHHRHTSDIVCGKAAETCWARFDVFFIIILAVGFFFVLNSVLCFWFGQWVAAEHFTSLLSLALFIYSFLFSSFAASLLKVRTNKKWWGSESRKGFLVLFPPDVYKNIMVNSLHVCLLLSPLQNLI